MATKDDFSEDEWEALKKGVTGAGMLVSVSDADFTDSFGEASALAKYLVAQRQSNESALLRDVVHTRGSGFGMTASPQKVEAETLEALAAAQAALTAKAPEELSGYRELVRGIAHHVAEAKSGVEAGETAAIEKIEQALGSA